MGQPKSKLGTALNALLVPALLFLLAVVFWGEMFVTNRVPVMRDMFFDALPQFTYAGGFFRSGHFPLWNTLSGWGKPFVADPQEGAFYPLRVFFYFLPLAWAIRAYCVTQLWIAGISMYALTRHWKLDVAPALLAAVVVMFNAMMIAHMEYANSQCVLVWSPLVMLFTSKLFENFRQNGVLFGLRTIKLVIALSVVLAVQLFAGYPEFVVGTGFIAAAYLVAAGIYWRQWHVLAKSIAALGMGCFFSLLIAAPQLLPTWEFLKYSERPERIDPMMGMASILPHNLLELLLPFINGSPGYPDKYWAGTVFEFWVGTCYVGLLPLVLAAFSSTWFRRKNEPEEGPAPRFLFLFSLGVIFFSVIMASGQYTPVYALLHEVPIVNRFRFPSKFLTYVPFALSLLAGLGYQALIELRADSGLVRIFQRRLIIGGSAFLGMLLLGLLLSHTDSTFFQTLTFGHFPSSPDKIAGEQSDFRLCLIFAAISLVVVFGLLRTTSPWIHCVVLAVAFANFFVVIRPIQPMLDEEILNTRSDALLSKIQQPELYRVHSAYSEDQLWLYGTHDEELLKWGARAAIGDSLLRLGLNQTWQGGQKLARGKRLYARLMLLPPDQVEKIARILGVRYFIHGDTFESIAWGGKRRTFEITELNNVLPRAYLVESWKQMTDDEAVLKRFLDDDFDPHLEAMVDPVSAYADSTAALPVSPDVNAKSPTPGRVLSLKDGPNETDIQLDAKTPSLLVLSDAWYPGWKALVDGAPATIFRTNFDFRGVFVQPGTHIVQFIYDPPLFRAGLIICAITSIFFIVILLFGSVKKLQPK